MKDKENIQQHELQQLFHLRREIDILKEELANEEPKMTHDKVKGSSTDFPYTLKNITITGLDVSEYNKRLQRIRKRLQNRIEELSELVERLTNYIDSVEDSEMRQILVLRYIKGLKWYQIPEQLGVEGDGSTQRKKHDRFLSVSPNSRK